MVAFQSHVLLGLFFFPFFFFLKISSEWTHEGKRLFGRCVQWWFHLRFQWRPFCLWPARSFKTEQEHDNSTDSILQPWNSQLLRSVSAAFLLCLYQLMDLKKEKKICFYSRGRVYTDIVTSVGQVFLRNTRVFQRSILLPDSHLMRFVCPQSAKLLFSLRLAMCVFLELGRVGSFGEGNKVDSVCTEASKAIPRATGAPPPFPPGS